MNDDRRFFGAAHGLRGRVCALHPLRAGDFDYLCALALTGEIPWQWNGHPETVEGFSESLRSGVLCQYAVVHRRSGGTVGLVRATAANFFHGHAYLTVYLDLEHRRSAIGMEASALLIEHLFGRYKLRKIYAETLAPILETFSSGVGEVFEIEARFKEYTFYEGEYVDKIVLTLDRSKWDELTSGGSFKT
jgi:RimJ/RimL family protein N-acetyltransferase